VRPCRLLARPSLILDCPVKNLRSFVRRHIQLIDHGPHGLGPRNYGWELYNPGGLEPALTWVQRAVRRFPRAPASAGVAAAIMMTARIANLPRMTRHAVAQPRASYILQFRHGVVDDNGRGGGGGAIAACVPRNPGPLPGLAGISRHMAGTSAGACGSSQYPPPVQIDSVPQLHGAPLVLFVRFVDGVEMNETALHLVHGAHYAAVLDHDAPLRGRECGAASVVPGVPPIQRTRLGRTYGRRTVEVVPQQGRGRANQPEVRRPVCWRGAYGRLCPIALLPARYHQARCARLLRCAIRDRCPALRAWN
jgi:hypothetical protein